MKKIVYIIFLLVVAIVAFIIGIIVGKNNFGSNSYSKDSVVGVYQTDSWNGEIGTLALYEDGTCQYPSGGNATWESEGDTVLIKIENGIPVQDGSIIGMTVYIDAGFSEEEIYEILDSIQKINNVSGVYWDEGTNLCDIELTVAESDNKTSGELSKIEGITIITYVLAEKPSISEYEAIIMENGLMLHEHFFKKVSD